MLNVPSSIPGFDWTGFPEDLARRLAFLRDGLVIEGHLRTHVVEQMTGGETDRAVGELLRLYKIQGPADA